MQGLVVRGVAGRRQEYRPIVSALLSSAEPLAVARAFRTHFGLNGLYVADLDAIAGQAPAGSLYRGLLDDGFRLWVDAGLGSGGAHLDVLAAVGVNYLIAGLESLSGPEELSALVGRFSSRRLVFSLDLKNGTPLAGDGWDTQDAWAIAERAVRLGVERVLVLDLARVGINNGLSTWELCERLRAAFPRLEITTGGGIRGPEDLRRARVTGVDCVLVASALHDRKLTRTDIACP